MDLSDRISHSARWRQEASEARARGDRATEAEALTYAAACFEPPTATSGEEGLIAPPADFAAEQVHADVCRRLGDVLLELGRAPHAIQAFQEAADVYRTLPGSDAYAAECVQHAVASLRELRAHPDDRLYLLIAKHEREQRGYAVLPGSEAQQGQCALRIADILRRRGRYSDAVERYQEAIALYQRAPEAPAEGALCHQRLADLLDFDMQETERAAAHYRQAVRLYADHEPLTEGRQINRQLCERRLRELDAELADRADRVP